MADAGRIREIVEQAVAEVLDREVSRLREELLTRVLRDLEPLLAPATESPTALLQAAVAAIQSANSQTDILSALLDGASSFAARAALFVLRGSTAVGWQARGFMDNNAIRTLSVDTGGGLAGVSLQQRSAVTGASAQWDPRLGATCGAPLDSNCQLLPLVIREKVAALLYADVGADPGNRREVDTPSLDLLVGAAGHWVELLALRKAAGLPPPTPQSVKAAVIANQPAVAEGTLAAAAVEPPSSSVAAPAMVAAAAAASAPAASGLAPSAAAPAPLPEPSATAEDEEVHRKAKRFAKLLVDEIKLYNQAKVEEGKQNRDLYDRLKDDIDKSRATYEKRYASTPAAAADYFKQELVRGLAGSNPALLGSNFPR